MVFHPGATLLLSGVRWFAVWVVCLPYSVVSVGKVRVPSAGMKAVRCPDVGHSYCRMSGLGWSLQGLLYIAERSFLSFSIEIVRRGLLL